MTIEFKFDVGDNVYYIRDNKVAHAKVITINFNKQTLSDGTVKTTCTYQVRDNADASTTNREERWLGHTQLELFEGVKMIGPEHDDKKEVDLWSGYKLEDV